MPATKAELRKMDLEIEAARNAEKRAVDELAAIRQQLAAAVERSERAEKQVDELATELGVTRAAVKSPELFRSINESMKSGVQALRTRAEAAEATVAGLRGNVREVISLLGSGKCKVTGKCVICEFERAEAFAILSAALAATPSQHAARIRERALRELAEDDTFTECTGTREGHRAIQAALTKLADEAAKEAQNDRIAQD